MGQAVNLRFYYVALMNSIDMRMMPLSLLHECLFVMNAMPRCRGRGRGDREGGHGLGRRCGHVKPPPKVLKSVAKGSGLKEEVAASQPEVEGQKGPRPCQENLF